MAEQKTTVAPSLTKLPVGASDFVLSQSYLCYLLAAHFGSRIIDLLGGIEARQYGLVAVRSRATLEIALDIFLTSEGHALQSPRNRFEVLAEVCGQSSHIYRDAWRLECANPKTPEDVIEYATQCRHFVEETLGMKPPKIWRAVITPVEHGNFVEACADLATLTLFLGIDAPYNPRFRKVAEERIRSLEAGSV